MSSQSQQVVNEKSECYIKASFYDINGVAYIPSSVRYRIDDVSNKVQIKAWTTISPLASVTITITSTENAMVSTKLPKEQRQVIIESTPAGGTPRYDDTDYTLVRVFGVS